MRQKTGSEEKKKNFEAAYAGKTEKIEKYLTMFAALHPEQYVHHAQGQGEPQNYLDRAGSYRLFTSRITEGDHIYENYHLHRFQLSPEGLPPDR